MKDIIIEKNEKTGQFELFAISTEVPDFKMKIKNTRCFTQEGAERAVERYKKLFNI